MKELSTARASAIPHSFHEDKADHDKHKDKKKKKKKKNEKILGPGEEKKKKKVGINSLRGINVNSLFDLVTSRNLTHSCG